MKPLHLVVIPHAQQRYDTVGDYEETDAAIEVRVSDTGDERLNMLVMVHELVEMFLCQARGISIQQVDDWDLTFTGEGEPGDDPQAPYHQEHVFAEMLERLMAHELGVEWAEYTKVLEQIDWPSVAGVKVSPEHYKQVMEKYTRLAQRHKEEVIAPPSEAMLGTLVFSQGFESHPLRDDLNTLTEEQKAANAEHGQTIDKALEDIRG